MKDTHAHVQFLPNTPNVQEDGEIKYCTTFLNPYITVMENAAKQVKI